MFNRCIYDLNVLYESGPIYCYLVVRESFSMHKNCVVNRKKELGDKIKNCVLENNDCKNKQIATAYVQTSSTYENYVVLGQEKQTKGRVLDFE